MALPYPSMSFVPLDILTAEEMNHMVANDQYLASYGATTEGSVSGTSANASWYVMRTIGGTRIISARYFWNTNNSATETTAAWGSMFCSTNPPSLGSWPVAFSSTPHVVATVVQDTLANYSVSAHRLANVTTTSAGNVVFMRQSSTSRMNVYLDVIAIGKV